MPSRFLHDVFASFGIRSEIIPNIVDVERFRFRTRSGCAPGSSPPATSRTLYNLPCTLRAFRLVQDRLPGRHADAGRRRTRRTDAAPLVEELRLENVTFAGRVPPDDIWRYYAEADLYLQTPDIDNMPASVLEAFASGCPVVATSAGGVPAILTHEQHGLLVPCDDHQASRRRDDPADRGPGAGPARRRRRARHLRALPVVVGPGPVGRALSPPRPAARPRGARPRHEPAIRDRPAGADRWTATSCASVSPAKRGRAPAACATRISPPRWHRSRLAADPRWRGARRSDAARDARAAITSRPRIARSPNTSGPAHRPGRSQARRARRSGRGDPPAFPRRGRRATVARADRIVEGRHDLLGYRDVALGNPPDWHFDAIHRRRAPHGASGRPSPISTRPLAITRSSGKPTVISTSWRWARRTG